MNKIDLKKLVKKKSSVDHTPLLSKNVGIIDKIELRENRDKPIQIQYGSANQVANQYGRCPICETGIKIIKQRDYAYCSKCGQLLTFINIYKLS